MAATTYLAILLHAGTAALYAFVAYALGRRVPPERPQRGIFNRFRLWWGCLAMLSVIDGTELALLFAGMLDVWAYQVGQQLKVILVCLALWGLLAYLTYIYRGHAGGQALLGVAYALVGVALLGVVAYSRPESLYEEYGEVETRSGTPVPPWLGGLILLVLVGPQLAAAFAFLRLAGRTSDLTTRYRIVLVSAGIIVWLGASLLVGLLDIHAWWWEVGSRVLGLLSATLVLLAYYPPGPVARRLRLQPWGQEEA